MLDKPEIWNGQVVRKARYRLHATPAQGGEPGQFPWCWITVGFWVWGGRGWQYREVDLYYLEAFVNGGMLTWEILAHSRQRLKIWKP